MSITLIFHCPVLAKIFLAAFIGNLLVPLLAFSPNPRSFWPNAIQCCKGKSCPRIYIRRDFSDKIFEDDDCQDLCGAWPEESNAFESNEEKKEDSTTRKTKLGSYRSKFKRRAGMTPLSQLGWKDPDSCGSCNGSGEQICRFCSGTSFLSAIGGDTDTLFMEGIGTDCPVCEDGLEVCHECAGTGWVFSWSGNRNATISLHP